MEKGDNWLLVGEYLGFKDRQTLRRLNQLVRRKIKIYKIHYGNSLRLTDDILKLYPDLRVLDASENPKITDKSVIGLKNLRELYAYGNKKITDELKVSLRKRGCRVCD